MSDSLKDYYDDLKDKMFISSIAIVHQRFSTNTFPSWDLPNHLDSYAIMEKLIRLEEMQIG